MQESQIDDTVSRVRADHREDLSNLRKKDRENVLKQRRLKLCEVETLAENLTLEQFKELILGIKQKKPSLELLKAIKNSCHKTSYVEAFFRTNGAFDSLIQVLVGNDALLQFESAACITNLACGSHKASHRIAKVAGPYLVSYITGGSIYLQDQSAWAAGNIANDCLECFSLLKAQGVLPALLTALQSPSPDVVQSATFALQACTKYGDSDLITLATPETIKLLLDLVMEENASPNTRSDAAFTLANIYYLLVQSNIKIDFAAVELILSLLCSETTKTSKNTLILLPLVHCLGFLSTHESICLQLSQHPSFYSIVFSVLSDKNLRKEMLWVLTNIVASSDTELPDFNIVLKIIDFLNPVDSISLQVLYFLCVLVSQSKSMKTLLQQPDVILKVKLLLHCGEKPIENACKCFFDILNVDT